MRQHMLLSILLMVVLALLVLVDRHAAADVPNVNAMPSSDLSGVNDALTSVEDAMRHTKIAADRPARQWLERMAADEAETRKEAEGPERRAKIATGPNSNAQANAGLLPEPPRPQGGEIVGSWVAEKVGLNAYVPAGLVQAVSPLTVEGETNGTITFGSDGSVQSDYTTATNISAVLLVPLSVSVLDTSRYEGNYTIASDTHALTITRANEDPLNYTYTATADSLHIIRPLLLDELLAPLPESVRGLAIGALSQHVPPDDPIKIVITFAKATDTETPSMLTGDFDGDGVVGIPDFLLFVDHFGTSRGDAGYDAKYDLDGNGAIGIPDFLIFVDNFGKEVSTPNGGGGNTGIVDIPDANLRAVIADSLGKASGAPITQAEMLTLIHLDASNKGIRNLTGLEHATNLQWLDLDRNSISDITPLSNLTNLTRLVLGRNSISDIAALSNLTNLTRLSIYHTSISDITPLSNLTNLTRLSLTRNSISDITPLSNLTNLTRLWLYGNSISDITPLSNLTNLTLLILYSNSISDIAALSNLTNLTRLSLSRNSISDVSALSGLTNLEWLDLSYNSISDLSPLVANTGLGSGDEVDVKNNSLSATSINMHVPALQNRGVKISFDPTPYDPTPVSIPDANLRAAIETKLRKASGVMITRGDMLNLTGLYAPNANISDLTGLSFATRLTSLHLGVVHVADKNEFVNSNEVSDLSPLSGLTNLTSLELRSNSISDISALSGLTNLTRLLLSDNSISDLSPLSGLTNLTSLLLRTNSISDISALSGLTNLTQLWLLGNSISDLSPLSGLTNLTSLGLRSNSISDLSPLVANTGLGSGDRVDVQNNPLSATSLNTHIPALQSRGVEVRFGASKPGVQEIKWDRIPEDREARTQIHYPTGGPREPAP